MERDTRHYEDYGYVLDFLPVGKAWSGKRYVAEPIVQLLGEEFFTLIEAALKPSITANPYERLYIGKDKRDKVTHIVGRISFNELTSDSKSELSIVVKAIVKKNETKFVDFFNKAQAITQRMHSFELLPGIGKKHMWQIVNERNKKPFESFDDLQKRTTAPDPLKAVVGRILDELEGYQKYRVFARQF
ncbi:MAG: DUF655 domain-containing protein [Candidatus Bathyarchaeota archaeon]